MLEMMIIIIFFNSVMQKLVKSTFSQRQGNIRITCVILTNKFLLAQIANFDYLKLFQMIYIP